MYDTVAQYGQVLSNEVDDWHPPVMVRLWQLLHQLAAGTAPMFALQTGLYAIGFGLIVAALVSNGRWRAAIAIAVVALSPLLLGWQMVVLKDAQMLGALVTAVGIVATYRLPQRKIPPLAVAAVFLLIAYATLVRANALFATVPLTVLTLPTRRRPAVTLTLAVAGILLILVLSPIINHRLLRAQPSNVAKAEPLFDLAAIAMHTADTPFTSAERAEIARRHCVKAFFWDPLGDPSACADATARVDAMPQGTLYRDLARAVAAHPLAYAGHRLRHWNSTERWLVAPGLPDAAPPIEAEPNDLGLGTPNSAFASSWHEAAAMEAGTPLAWPIFWTVIALIVVPSAWRRRNDPAGSLALALLASALALEASFLVISIASDLRYHLWPMTASALALILLSDDFRMRRRDLVTSGILLLIVVVSGLVTRASLPRAPATYQGMIHAVSG